MKKILSLLLSMTLVFSLAACSGGAPSSEGGASEPAATSSEPASASSQPSSQTPSNAETSSNSEETEAPYESAESAEEPTEETSGILIAYFSWSGNTEQMAQMIQAETGGDLFEIEPAVPYTEDYNTLLDVAQQEQADNARPELAAQVENWDSYDVVFVGYPDWWSDAPCSSTLFWKLTAGKAKPWFPSAPAAEAVLVAAWTNYPTARRALPLRRGFMCREAG